MKRANGEGSLFLDKRTGRYNAIITVGYDEQGKRIRKKASAKTKHEALNKLKKLHDSYKGVTYIDADSITLTDWLNRWYAVYVEPTIRESTKANYAYRIALASKTGLDMTLSKVTPSDIQKSVNKVASGSADAYRKMLKRAFDRAIDDGLLTANPVRHIKLPQHTKCKFIPPTDKQIQAIINAKTPFYWWHTAVLIEFLTGIRREELLALKWKNISIEKNKITVSIKQALTLGKKIDGHREILLSPTKTESSERNLALPLTFANVLKEHKVKQNEIRLASPVWVDNDFLFCTDTGEPIHPTSFSTFFFRLKKRLGVNVTFHGLRHLFASRMKAANFDVKDIQGQLGHSNIHTTLDIYTHIINADERDQRLTSWLDTDLTRIKNSGSTVALSTDE